MTDSNHDPVASPRLYPPVYFISALALIFFLEGICPGALLSLRSLHWGFMYLGVLVSLAGILLFWDSARLFLKYETRLTPFAESTHFVRDRAFRFSRNPVYLGMFLVQLGVEIALGLGWGILVCAGFFWLIHTRFVLPEEVHMERAFGDEYLEFKKSVRRWL